ncbi:hypothetical protein [Mucilaginibacter sp. NFR10]|uniref:hypothetical protein n=1 Tax=Mucilaginibacter sp. NFR10 TaxID=1566292 RepID=UPI0008711E0B|nr:hypothetical protein [Mucilaginibacter sp. NFR10]SCW83248.1 hypothetical protein SAMN03159284_04737 [Mucilaginibacter sp. NFR10]
METISSDKFLTLFSNGLEVIDKTILGNISLEKINVENLLAVKNCVFEGSVSIKGVTFNNSVIFENCTLKKGLSSTNTIFNEQLTWNECNTTSEITFFNTSFQNLQFNGGEYKEITLNGAIKSPEHTTGQIRFKKGSYKQLKFSSSDLDCSIELRAGYYNTVFFEKNKLNQYFTISENVEINNFYISSSEFSDRVAFSNGTITEIFWLSTALFNSQVVVDKEFKVKSFYLNHVLARQNFGIKYDGNIENLSIHSCEFVNSFNCYFSTAIEAKEDISGLSFTIDGIIKGNIILDNITVPSISISGVNLGNIIFKKIETHLITITDFYNQSKLTFADLKLVYKNHALIIFDSNINTTEFVNVDFRKFEELVIAKSEVSSLILSNSVFPPKIQIGTKNPKFGYIIKADEKISDNVYYKETYRQLKLAADKQGNRASSLAFRSQEMHYFRKELPWGWDKVVLYLNYLSNNHGLSWSRGVVFTVIISWILFISYEASLTNPAFSWTFNGSFKDLCSGFYCGLLSFSNFWASFPLFKNLESEHITWKTNLVFILSRIFMGYGIYQTIPAFRKFVIK